MTERSSSSLTCHDVQEHLLDYLEGMVKHPEIAHWEAHFRQCNTCSDQLKQTRDLLGDLDAAGSVDAGRSSAQARPGDPFPHAEAVPTAGTRIGDFEIVNELGRGGMGIVYRARQCSLDRIVALKVLPPALGRTETAVHRFRSEVRTAARLRHPHIVPIHAWGEQDGVLHYAMELIEGRPLSEVIDEQRRKSLGLQGTRAREWFRRTARSMADVADALEHAHEQGIIHRDIKPQNLLVGTDGRIHVADFGLARALDDPGVTDTGEVVGTPAYMSPEQTSGHRDRVDRRSDVWSLGVTIYEVLTLRRPFDAPTRDRIIDQIRNADPVRPRTIDREIPVDLETICLKMLEKEPDRRYATAYQLARDLRLFAGGQPISARRVGLMGRVRVLRGVGRWCRGVMNRLPGRHADTEPRIRQAFELLAFHDYHQGQRARSILETVDPPRRGAAPYHTAWALATMLDSTADTLYHLDRALDDDPENCTALYLQAWALRKHYPSRAREGLERADAIGGPRSAAQHFLRGQAIMGLGGETAEEEAIACYREAIIHRRPDVYPQAMLHLGRALNHWMFHHRLLERFDETQRNLTTVANLQEDQAYPRYLLSIAYRLGAEIYAENGVARAQDYYEQAARHAGDAQKIEPDNALGAIAEAEALASQRDFSGAIEAYDRALTVAENAGSNVRRREVYEYRWRLHFWSGHADRALADLDARVRGGESESTVELWFASLLRAIVCAERGDGDQARRYAALAAEQSPTVPAAVLASAAALRLVGRSDQAEAVLSRHLPGVQWDRTVFPYESAQWNRSLYRFCTGESDWAALEGAVGRWGPEDPTWLLAQAYFFSGVGRLAQGDRDRAAERFRQCVKTYDYERYSFLAQTLLVRMETSPGWPAWLSGDGPSR
ncbi:MAG: protein kinase [Planctomycetes bacterium]|nr:protein kinase [Planctomycetota bacterium]